MANHLVLRCVLVVGGTSWKEVRHASTGNLSIGCILLCGFGPAWCPSTPPCCSGSKQKPSWACGTGRAVCGCSCGTPTQTSSCGSEFILLDGSKCAALARLMVPTILASRARQKWVAVLASAAGRGHVVMREGRPRWLCRVARWSFLIKPLQWQLGQHAYCLDRTFSRHQTHAHCPLPVGQCACSPQSVRALVSPPSRYALMRPGASCSRSRAARANRCCRGRESQSERLREPFK